MTQSINQPYRVQDRPVIAESANAKELYSTSLDYTRTHNFFKQERKCSHLEGSLQAIELTQVSPGWTTKQHTHYKLYNFWSRSEGLWLSKLVKVAVRFLSEQELLAVSQIHLLDKAEFGVKMSWEYNTKEELGHMLWCVNAMQPGLVFTDKGLSNYSSPQVLHYQMVNDNKLVITTGKYEETFLLDGDSRRLRELRYEGKLVRRLRENKLVVS